MQKYTFPKKLIEGLILSRPNRFIMKVNISGKSYDCHCPSTGRIGSIRFENIPCLLSESNNPERKTKFTVEAFSLDPIDKKNKDWIGINQTKANEYVDFFIRSGQLENMLGGVNEIKRESPLGDSRIDFLLNGKLYLEVKTPLKEIPSEKHPNYTQDKLKFTSFDRLIKHFKDVSSSLKNKEDRAIFVLCYIYDAEPFKIPKQEKINKIVRAAKKAHMKGIEHWQINLILDEEGIELKDCFKLNLF